MLQESKRKRDNISEEFKQQQAGQPAGKVGQSEGDACDNQGWARRLRDLDVRGGAAEGTAPWPCVGV